MKRFKSRVEQPYYLCVCLRVCVCMYTATGLHVFLKRRTAKYEDCVYFNIFFEN
uniref:Uncharacterized protein n=1 Tax=Anguilla anguilla TaxID=7936 RepID=A0A0E9S5A8_ANGAN